MSRNATIIYEEKRAATRARIEDAPRHFARMAEALKKYDYPADADTILAVMFNPSEIESRKRAEFEQYADSVSMPDALRYGQLATMLAEIPAGLIDETDAVRREFNAAQTGFVRSDFEAKRGKFYVTAEKQAALLSDCTHTLTDAEQTAFESISGAIDTLRKWRDSFNVGLIVRDFLGDKMHPENDKPLADIARYVHEHHESSRAEILQMLQEREEKERADNAAIAAEIAADKKKGGEGTPVRDGFLVRQFRAIREFRAANAGREHYSNDNPANAD